MPKYFTLKPGETFLTYPSSGAVVPVQRFHEASALKLSNPYALTDFDIQVIESFSGVRDADAAVEAREKARIDRPVSAVSIDQIARRTRAQVRLTRRQARRVTAAPAAVAGSAATSKTFDLIGQTLEGLLMFAQKTNTKNAERNQRIEALEERLKAAEYRLIVIESDHGTRLRSLEDKPEIHDGGVWRSGIQYEKNALISHGGCGWICRERHLSTGAEPDHKAFRLLVKKGRDGKDAR